jgi:hypothetical protein
LAYISFAKEVIFMGAVALFFTGMAVGMVFGIIIMGLAVAAGRDKRETE